MITIMLVALLCIPDQAFYQDEANARGMKFYSSFYTFRFFFMLIFIVACAGFVVKTLKKYRVNYMYIFEFDP